MTRYSEMTNEEFIIYLRKYMIDGCHPQICSEAAERLEKQIPNSVDEYKNILISLADVRKCIAMTSTENVQPKCMSHNVVIKPDGLHELDPCVYEEIEEHTGCTVRVLKCRKCGHVEIEWEEDP